MAVGKTQKRISKGKKGQKKKTVDPFTKKEWYDVRTPAIFQNRNAGKTPVTRTTGLKVASDGLKGRVFDMSLADLTGNEEQRWRKMQLICEEVQGKHVLTNFYGMDMTRDKQCSLIKKWQTLIEAWADVKTTDGYILRLFVTGFTNWQENQTKKTAYAQSSQIRAIRRKMTQIMNQTAATADLKEMVQKFVAGSIGTEIQKACSGVFPMRDVSVRKVKLIKSPAFDFTKLMELHNDTSSDAGAPVTKVEEGNVATLPGAGGRL